MVDILSGIPSIVAALFIYALFITIFGFGRSVFAVGCALVLLMLPWCSARRRRCSSWCRTRCARRPTPSGCPKWKTIVKVVIPTAFSGISTGVVLGLARSWERRLRC
jgi:phosphate transport system permease protein